MQLGTPRERLQTTLTEIVGLLNKHRVLETMTHNQETMRRDLLEHMQRQQNLVELQSRCRRLHPADLAFVLEALPHEDRALVWNQSPASLRGAVLVEVSPAVREWLLDNTERDSLVEALRGLPTDDLAYLEGEISEDVWSRVSDALAAGERTLLQESKGFPEGSVGEVMGHDAVAIRESSTVEEGLTELRTRPSLPRDLDAVCVVDGRNVLRGVLSLTDLIRHDPAATVGSVMTGDPVVFQADEPIAGATEAFERYDLLSAPVTDSRGKLVGRLTADVAIDQIRAATDRAALQRAGLGGDEDLYASVYDSARNRWPWLLVNLVTAFIASRVIGVFEQTIERLVALATLMPIVASIGGNTGNQTIALVIRGLALEQLQAGTFGQLLRKEVTVSFVNGALWGSILGLFAVALYRSVPLGAVMMAAVLLNLLIAAVVGVLVPVALQRAGRDPAQGASVLLTFVTDSMGFFLFLGLAQVFLR